MPPRALVLVCTLSMFSTAFNAGAQGSRAETRLRERCAAGREKPERCTPELLGLGGGDATPSAGGGGGGSSGGAGGAAASERRSIAQAVPNNVWQWGHCGSGTGRWVGSSGTINRGTGQGEIKADGTGTFEFRWTNLGGIEVEIEESGTLRLEPARTAAGEEQRLTVTTTSVEGFWKPPRPLPRIPADPASPPSPNGAFTVSVAAVAGRCEALSD